MKRKFVFVGLILIFSLIATLLSFFYKQNLSMLGLTRFGYGFPLSWYMESQMVYPYSPIVASVVWVNFFLDVFVWSIIVTLASIIIVRARER